MCYSPMVKFLQEIHISEIIFIKYRIFIQILSCRLFKFYFKINNIREFTFQKMKLISFSVDTSRQFFHSIRFVFPGCLSFVKILIYVSQEITSSFKSENKMTRRKALFDKLTYLCSF